MQQSPNQRINKFELDLRQDRLNDLTRALKALIAASDATVHVTPDLSHFTPTVTKETLFAEYAENVTRNLQPQAVSEPEAEVMPPQPVVNTQAESARQQVNSAYQVFPLPVQDTKEYQDA